MKTRTWSDRRSRRRVGIVALAMLLPLTACGTRSSIEEINAAERGDVGLDPSMFAAQPGTAAGAGAGPAVGALPDAAGAPAVGGAVAPGTGRGTAPAAGTQAQRAAGAASSGADGADARTAQKATSSGTTVAARTCTGSEPPIVIGQTGAFSGLLGAAVGGAKLGLALWVQAVNSAGGIACHPVKAYQLDDGSSPSQAAANAEDLIKNKKAIAIVGVAQPIVLDATRSVTSKAGIPIVGGDLFGVAWSTDPLLFQQGTSAVSSFAVGLQAAAESVRATKAGVMYCVEAEICAVLNRNFDAIAKVAGLQPVYRQSMSITQTSFTSNCQNAKAAGAEVLFLGMEGASIQRVANSCAAIGYNPVIAAPGLAVPASVEINQQLQRNTVFLGAGVAPFKVDLLPAQKAFHEAVKRFGGGQPIDQNTLQGWVAGKLFEAALNSLGDSLATRAVTTPDVFKGLYSLPKNETLGGLAPPLNFSEGKPAPNIGCGFVVALLKGGFQAPVGNKRVGTCTAPAP